ncbi:MAG TPA: energy transducer TonB [Pyrinomonadaceae bacterium]|nr:energy transducer TonB [Pyrinomonadaceae bacterium]
MLETLKVEGSGDGGKKLVLGVVANGKAISKPKADYPENLKAAGVAGRVTVKVTIDEKGDVTEARAVSGEPLLRGPAEAAALRAKYTPTTLCGRPVKVSGVITYNFAL